MGGFGYEREGSQRKSHLLTTPLASQEGQKVIMFFHQMLGSSNHPKCLEKHFIFTFLLE